MMESLHAPCLGPRSSCIYPSRLVSGEFVNQGCIIGAATCSQSGEPAILEANTRRKPDDISGQSQKLIAFLLLALGLILTFGPANAETEFKPIAPQYIAALGDKGANSGTGAETWGLWNLDPGPRGVRLSAYEALKAGDGVAPARWKFDGADWWLEEHGLIMEQPQFPIPPGKYVVTGDREVTTVLTVHPKGSDGTQRWELGDGAALYDVTHLRCRSARYTPAAGSNSCSPDKAEASAFPVFPGEPMPPVGGCNKQDYEVLIVVGIAADN